MGTGATVLPIIPSQATGAVGFRVEDGLRSKLFKGGFSKVLHKGH